MKAIVMTAPGGPEAPQFQKLSVRRLVCAISFTLLIMFANSAKAEDIYKCNDENGRIVFSDKPCPQGAEKIPIKNPHSPTSGVRLRLIHNGKSINTITKVVPLFSLEIEKEGNYSRYFLASPRYERFPKRYNRTDDTYSILVNITEEGSYVINVAIDTNPDNPIDYPGDYQGGAIMLVPKEIGEVFNVQLEKVMHLLQPQDNGSPLLQSVHSCEKTFSTKGPVNILWESLGPNVQYVYEIKPLVCKPFCCSPQPPVLNDSTTDTFLISDLPVNKEGEIYSLTINAWDTVTHLPVGSLISHGQRGYTSGYRFRIVK